MLNPSDKKASYFNSPAWIWGRIRSLRNFRANLDDMESLLLNLKTRVEIEKRNQTASNQPATTIEREPAQRIKGQ